MIDKGIWNDKREAGMEGGTDGSGKPLPRKMSVMLGGKG